MGLARLDTGITLYKLQSPKHDKKGQETRNKPGRDVDVDVRPDLLCPDQ